MRTGGSKIPWAQQPGKSRDSSSGASRLRLACHIEVIITGKSSHLVAFLPLPTSKSQISWRKVLSSRISGAWVNQVSWVKVVFFTSFTYVTYPMLYDTSRFLTNSLKILKKNE